MLVGRFSSLVRDGSRRSLRHRVLLADLRSYLRLMRPWSQLSYQEKTPAARRQTRERVGNELNSADTLSYDENEHRTHPPTIPQVSCPVNFILVSGRTLAALAKRGRDLVGRTYRRGNASSRRRTCLVSPRCWVQRRFAAGSAGELLRSLETASCHRHADDQPCQPPAAIVGDIDAA